MGSYFLDTSAIVKRYVPAEQGYAWVAALCHPAQGHKLFICADIALSNVAIAEGLSVENPNDSR